MINNLIGSIFNMAMNNPAIKNNPQASNYLNVIQSGDSARGEEIARNICNSYGVTPEEAMKQAKSFFNL